jgi:hypothetical protein
MKVFLGYLMLAITLTSAMTGCVEPEKGTVVHLPKTYLVDGSPVRGTYGAHAIEDLKAVRDAGMNLTIGGANLLDTSTAVGAFCRDNRIRVMYHLTSHIYGKPLLKRDIPAGTKTIPIDSWPASLPDSGVVQIDSERIRYFGHTDTTLIGCQRGVEGTEASSHLKRTILFWPEAAAREISEVKDSPNLWGYYVLDDSPGDALSALRALYGEIKRVDTDHPVWAGFGGLSVMHNFGIGMCDGVLLYRYPFFEDEYDRNYISLSVQHVMAEVRRKVPGMPFIGVYQGFWGIPSWTTRVLSPAQIKVQMEDFVREGVSGLIAFCAMRKTHGSGFDGWNTQPSLVQAIREVHDEISSTGAMRISDEPDTMKHARVQPRGFWMDPDRMPGVVQAWHVIGPFDDEANDTLSARFAPEDSVDLSGVYPGKFGDARWVGLPYHRMLDLVQHVDGRAYPPSHESSIRMQHTIAYATCTVSSDRERTAQMRVGSDDDVVVWFDGREVWRHEGSRGFTRDNDIVPVTIPRGRTRILVKVCNRIGNFALFIRFMDNAGRALDGLVFEPSLQEVDP